MTSITIQVADQTKERILDLGGERGMGKTVDMLIRFFDQQTSQQTQQFPLLA